MCKPSHMLRIAKRIAQGGVASRRQAEALIQDGSCVCMQHTLVDICVCMALPVLRPCRCADGRQARVWRQATRPAPINTTFCRTDVVAASPVSTSCIALGCHRARLPAHLQSADVARCCVPFVWPPPPPPPHALCLPHACTGRVTLNGVVVTSPAVNVSLEDTVLVDGAPIAKPGPPKVSARRWVRGGVCVRPRRLVCCHPFDPPSPLPSPFPPSLPPSARCGCATSCLGSL